MTVYWQGRKVGRAVPQVIGRHAHPKAPPDEDPAPAALTGIDYLASRRRRRRRRPRRAAQPRRPRRHRRPGGRRDPAADPAASRRNDERRDPRPPASWPACSTTPPPGCAPTSRPVMLIDRHGRFLHDPAFRRIIAAGVLHHHRAAARGHPVERRHPRPGGRAACPAPPPSGPSCGSPPAWPSPASPSTSGSTSATSTSATSPWSPTPSPPPTADPRSACRCPAGHGVPAPGKEHR